MCGCRWYWFVQGGSPLGLSYCWSLLYINICIPPIYMRSLVHHCAMKLHTDACYWHVSAVRVTCMVACSYGGGLGHTHLLYLKATCTHRPMCHPSSSSRSLDPPLPAISTHCGTQVSRRRSCALLEPPHQALYTNSRLYEYNMRLMSLAPLSNACSNLTFRIRSTRKAACFVQIKANI